MAHCDAPTIIAALLADLVVIVDSTTTNTTTSSTGSSSGSSGGGSSSSRSVGVGVDGGSGMDPSSGTGVGVAAGSAFKVVEEEDLAFLRANFGSEVALLVEQRVKLLCPSGRLDDVNYAQVLRSRCLNVFERTQGAD